MSDTKLTLKEVARRLDVSTATISNAFNRPDQLSAKKRAEVLAACEEMGYAGPNKAARSLRRGQTNIIALVLPDSIEYMVTDPVASQLIQGVAKAIKDSEANLLLFSGSNDSVNEIVDFVDGFICYGSPRSQTLLRQLTHIKKRVVTIDFDIENAPSVNIDNTQAAYKSALLGLDKQVKRPVILGLRLLDLEHTCVVGQNALLDSEYSISHRRLDGYLDAIKAVGLDISNDDIWHIHESTHEAAIVAVKQVLSANKRPDALLCMSDIIALTAMQEALRLGLRIPEDVRVVGFDGTDIAKRYHPTLTTVQQFSALKGEVATQMFLNGDDQSKTVDFELISGDSTLSKN